MRWLDGGGVRPLNTLRTIGVSAILLAIFALAALETWIEHAAGQREVAAGVERAGPDLPTGAGASPAP